MTERAKGSQFPGDYPAQAALDLVADGTSDEQVIWKNDTTAPVKIKSAGIVPDDAITGDDTNNFILQLKNRGSDGSGTKNISAAKTYASGVNVTQFAPDSLVLSTTPADLLVAPGEVIALLKTETGAGLTLPAGIAFLTFEYQ